MKRSWPLLVAITGMLCVCAGIALFSPRVGLIAFGVLVAAVGLLLVEIR